MTTLILGTQPPISQQKKPPQSVPLLHSEAVQMQNNIYLTLSNALNRLDGWKHRAYIVRVLQLMMIPGVQEVATPVLVDLLFSIIDECWDARQLLDYQNLLLFGFWLLKDPEIKA